MPEVEVGSICRKYESFRLREAGREKYLLGSILEHGVREPLRCVEAPGEGYHYILLDGFKRLRCCCTLKIQTVPILCVGVDEVDSILHLIRASNDRTLNTLEQARFVDELHVRHGLSVTEIAGRLERSNAWVSVRLGIVERMSEAVKEALFSGRFPVRCYMYTLRPFTRVKGTGPGAIDRFVASVAGKGLTTRQIDKLAYGYFRGGSAMRGQIEEGNHRWTLARMGELDSGESSAQGMSEAEWNLVRDLELVQKYILRLLSGLTTDDPGSNAFQAHALLLIEGVLEKLERFAQVMRSFHDRGTHQGSGSHAL